MLKKLVLGAALAGSLGLSAIPAHADHVCFTIYLNVNGTIVEQLICTPV